MGRYEYGCPLCQRVFSGPWMRPMDPTVCPQCEEDGQRMARELLGRRGLRRAWSGQTAALRVQRLRRNNPAA